MTSPFTLVPEPEQRTMEWQPIETAPMDGTPVLLVRRRLKKGDNALGEPEIVIGAYTDVWVAGNKEWVAFVPGDLGNHQGNTVESLTIRGEWGPLAKSIGPTHWMPLPEPPK